ncbi:hypothetical protein [Agromyces sp. CCNWLW203]|uniref:hypothetical protein n=1 Tax=Agromyces sp. CCNWLW203 TaxID=3112842 RepID=UPI002F962C66
MTDTPASPRINHEEHWTQSARDAVDTVLKARPDLAGAESSMLVEVAELITAADDLMREARSTSMTATGSKGQLIASPLIVEARLHRTAAGALLGKLAPPRPAQGSRGGNGRFRARMDGTVSGHAPAAEAAGDRVAARLGRSRQTVIVERPPF